MNSNESKIKCPLCFGAFKIPITLPCGETACKNCIFKENDFKECIFCKENHQIPKDGFKPNKLILSLIDSKMESNFEEELKNLKENFLQLKNWFLEGNSRIENYCSLLRDDVQLKTESAIETLNQINKSLMEKIQEYEKERISKFKQESEFKLEVNDLINKIELFFKGLENSERSVDIVKEYNQNIMEILVKMNHIIFEKNYLVFEDSSETINSNTIGTLRLRENNKRNNAKIEIINLKEIYNQANIDFNKIEFLYINKLENQGQVLVYRYLNRTQNYLCFFDKLQNLIKKFPINDCSDFKVSEICCTRNYVLTLVKSINGFVIIFDQNGLVNKIDKFGNIENIKSNDVLVFVNVSVVKNVYDKTYNFEYFNSNDLPGQINLDLIKSSSEYGRFCVPYDLNKFCYLNVNPERIFLNKNDNSKISTDLRIFDLTGRLVDDLKNYPSKSRDVILIYPEEIIV